jgi:hypothetical protein
MTPNPGEHFHERSNPDGTLDLMCLLCRALIAENVQPSSLPALEAAHSCSAGRSSFSLSRWRPGAQRRDRKAHKAYFKFAG